MIVTQIFFWVHIKSNIYGYTDYRCVLLPLLRLVSMYWYLAFYQISIKYVNIRASSKASSTLLYFFVFCQNILYRYFFLQLFCFGLCFVYLLLYSDRRWFRVRVTLPENYPGKRSYISPYLQLELRLLAQISDLDIGGFVYV